ncbi:HAMP domain-containing sensor histidine kinase [Desulfobacterales bacterium HSG16]|nr:HAMP domain-containing sensor histidine kinase [Desulfobacterales bacterium HSG16]
MPKKFRERIKNLPPGVHAVHILDKKRPINVGVIRLPDKDILYYMIFHGREFFQENDYLHPKEILMLSLAFLLIPGIIIGYFTSRMLFAPVDSLMNQIKNLNPENIQTQFPYKHAANELGMFTRTIETTMNRIKAFITREKQFTRDASHELRTPLTIIKGAVEIMEQQPELAANPLLAKPLKRILRSTRDMETTIETFLWLAREEKGPEESCSLEPLVRKAISDHQYLMENKKIDLKVDIRHDKSVKVKKEILYITVTNLIRNAFHFTTEGSVSIIIEETHFEIRDTGIGINSDQLESVTRTHIKGEKSLGFGLGLSIVSRLCDRFGWELSIVSRSGEGTIVKILWHDS